MSAELKHSSRRPSRLPAGRRPNIRIGISGWRYSSWRKVFYPDGLVQRRELEYAASRFNSVELNGSFYSLQKPALYASWRDQTPADFLFSVKGGRYITHLKKLKGVEIAGPRQNELSKSAG